MAAAALGGSAPAPLRSPPSPAAPSGGSTPLAMPLARPKSAKGRRRPSLAGSQSLGACPCRGPPSPTAPPQPASGRRALATKPAFLAGYVSPEEIPELLQQVPSRSSSSLNRYRVLPSIGWRAEGELPQHGPQLRAGQGREGAPQIQALSGERGPAGGSSEGDLENKHLRRPLEKQGGKLRQGSPSPSPPGPEEPPWEEPRLLLALRSPSGRRFQRLFKPSDSLQQVLAVAGQEMLADYQHCSLETMEVPRRSFPDLRRSLQECGILPRSVLCIRRPEPREAGP